MSNLPLDVLQALNDANMQEVPFVVALNNKTKRQVILPLSAINGRWYTILYVCLSNGHFQAVQRE